ncbi:Ninjurin-1 [Eufriesea mexicana]|uniref:ninjurin-1-like n=1 Tax=Eufriesea mexicana TaxID=516756 RepID=UPI00083C7F54|nr:PREDICTED: ninjurin-1-like [Eufriesea mexicana]OAD60599.1 Ninjurin-1 [Eufriesea mexicana]
MSQEKNKSDEIIYMDEISDEKPPISKPTEVNFRSRSSSIAETDNTNKPQQSVDPDVDHLESTTNFPISFDSRIDNDFSPSELGISETPRTPFLAQAPLQTIPDVNVYQHKKTLAQGMMDLALLSANANQLRYVLQTDGRHPYFYPALVLIGSSLLLQIAVGIGLILNSRYNVKDDDQMCKADRANNWTVIGIFLVTIFNVFISSFGVVDQVSTAAVTA